MMNSVNRMALVLKAKQPMVDWVNKLPDKGGLAPEEQIDAESVSKASPILLIPQLEANEDPQPYLTEMKAAAFEFILQSWCLEEDWWPKDLSEKNFDEWFSIEIHPQIFDLSNSSELRLEMV